MLDLARPGARLKTVLAVSSALALAVSGCAKSEDDDKGTASPQNSQAQQQVTATAAAGATCTLDKFGGKKFDPKSGVVGFSQSEKEANPFRIAETGSIKDEAKKTGVSGLRATNAQSQFGKQISDVQQLIAQGAQALVIAPLNSDGWQPVLAQAAAKKIPIITVDRKINATPCKDYLTFIGSDFVAQGRRAADQMAKALGGKGKVAILLGAAGNNVTTERTQGFKDEIKAKAPGIQVTFEQTGEFTREKGQSVTEQLVQSHPDIDAIYAENDEMALGAVTALKGAGKKPGEVKIVSVDGTHAAVQGIVDGWISAVIESNPRFGPLAFQTLTKFLNGEPIPEKVTISDREYDSSNAKQALDYAY
ncbi:ABC transporter substrate-binding protein [Actinomadura parmotrematis]|uniref:ABC transporter substrate-binding protein n=1 Tax=Actinomadura parmotrematis TaxID=2864039 RepID=A0ABS7G7C3_9ACTN|nr:ABC transporter substrate-binding protein [Actinomadura parmotrematis]MBW8487523.1 ABC transporter substrate-binding protein [Actinomadura parmotrematis]